MFDYMIVGAGFAGSVLAERLAAGMNKKVLIVDRRPHIGGNAYDCYDEHGILIHKYGPHIFHTNSAEIFDYLSRFTAWRQYQHRGARAWMAGWCRSRSTSTRSTNSTGSPWTLKA
ncbi:MAG: NAD(P)-binding protein [Opitutus sp.]|nr:NAD(P)-binding protein [Opitutus sp.]